MKNKNQIFSMILGATFVLSFLAFQINPIYSEENVVDSAVSDMKEMASNATEVVSNVTETISNATDAVVNGQVSGAGER